MAYEKRIRSDLGYEDKQRINGFKKLYDSKLLDDDVEIMETFDSAGSISVQSGIEAMTGAEIRELRSRLAAERQRIELLLLVIDDVNSQIVRSLEA